MASATFIEVGAFVIYNTKAVNGEFILAGYKRNDLPKDINIDKLINIGTQIMIDVMYFV